MEATTTRFESGPPAETSHRVPTETKSALRTTEFATYVFVTLAILIAGAIAGDGDGVGGTDYFGADKVWLYVTILTVGYMLSRGLAKSGSRAPYWEESNVGGRIGSVAGRVKAAAHVLAEGEGGQRGDSRSTPPPTGAQY